MEKKTDFKALTNRAKVQYIWDYYRWPILIAVVVAAFIISLAHHYITYKDPLLNVIMINVNDSMSADDSGFHEFLQANNYNPKNSPVSLSANLMFPEGDTSGSYNDLQVLSVMIAAGGQDLFFGTGDIFLNYANQGALADLRTVLSEDTLAKYQDHLIYSTDDGETDSYPCAVELTDNRWLKQNNYYDSCYFGVFSRSGNPDTAKQFADFLLNYK